MGTCFNWGAEEDYDQLESTSSHECVQRTQIILLGTERIIPKCHLMIHRHCVDTGTAIVEEADNTLTEADNTLTEAENTHTIHWSSTASSPTPWLRPR